MTFDFHPESKAEFLEATHYYEDRSYLAGDRFVAAVRAAVNVIMTDPQRWPTARNNARVIPLKKFPFRLYYTWDEAGQHICIQAVMHEKRRPDYWRRRN